MGSFYLFPKAASTIADQVDAVTIGLIIVSTLMLALVFGLIIVFGILYRKGSPRTREMSTKGQHALEWGWTFATLFVFLGLFAWGAEIYLRTHVPPADASEIMVVGKQWMWKFQHPNGVRELNELHVPVGVPVLLTMTSQDVIHSFFVPEFRIKQDVLPGRYIHAWFTASRPGVYHLLCTQYCGTMHAEMRGKIIVQTQSEYERWLQSGISSAASTMADRGQALFTRLGCISCHGVHPGVKAPSLAGIYGNAAHLSDGTDVLVDDNYLRESILNPRAKIVMGYQNLMPSFAGVIGEEDLLDLMAYVKSLRATPTGESSIQKGGSE